MIGKFQKRYIINKNLSDINPVDFGMFTVPGGYCHSQLNDVYYVYSVVSGTFNITRGEENASLTSGEICIIPPNTQYVWGSDEDDPCKIIWIGFDGAYGKRFERAVGGFVTQYDGPLFREMWSASYRRCREEYIAGTMMQLYCELAERNTPAPVSNHIRNAKDCMEVNYINPTLNVSKVAENVGIDRRYMSRIFKETEGISPQEYLTNLRMGRALELLGMGFSIAEVSTMCGYSSPFHFSTMFKKVNGVSPSKYRTIQKNKQNSER